MAVDIKLLAKAIREGGVTGTAAEVVASFAGMSDPTIDPIKLEWSRAKQLLEMLGADVSKLDEADEHMVGERTPVWRAVGLAAMPTEDDVIAATARCEAIQAAIEIRASLENLDTLGEMSLAELKENWSKHAVDPNLLPGVK